MKPEALIKILSLNYPSCDVWAGRGRKELNRLEKRVRLPSGSMYYDLGGRGIWIKKQKWKRIPGT